MPASDDDKRPAAPENSRLLAWLIAAGGLAYMFDYYVARRRPEPQCHQLQLPDPGHPAARHAAPPAGQPGRSHVKRRTKTERTKVSTLVTVGDEP